MNPAAPEQHDSRWSPRAITRPASRLSLTWRFGIAAFVAIAALGLVLMEVLSSAIIHTTLEDARAEARDSVGRLVLNHLSPDELAAPLAGERLAQFEHVVGDVLDTGRTARIKVWNTEGRIIYATNAEQVGEVFPIDDELGAALDGRTVSEVAERTKPENADLDDSGPLLEVYTPIVFPSSQDVAGAFEIYQFYEPVARQIAEIREQLTVGLGAGLALLYVALVGIVHGGARTISRQHRQLERAFHDQARLTAILEATPDFVATADADGCAQYINRAGRRMLGVGEDDDVSGISMDACCTVWAQAGLSNQERTGNASEDVWSGETSFLSRDGREIPVSQVILAHRTPTGSVDFVSTIARDISDRKQFEAKLVRLASRDPLTDLRNRRQFHEELERELARARRSAGRGAVLFLDLDDFKRINDTLGHRAGDELLAGLAGLLRDELREADVPARLGGDEFAVLLPQVDAAEAQAVAERLLQAIRRRTFVVDGELLRLTTSIGIALFPEHGTTAEELLVHADLARYRAKEQRDQWCLYAADEDAQAALTAQRVWEHRLREALEQERLVLYAQPVHGLRNGSTRYELLLRLVDADGKVVAPGAFLGVAERSGLIHAIDRWVVRKAIQLMAELRQSGRELSVEVNLSGKAFTDKELLPLIHRQLASSGINPACLTFEITETAAITSIDRAQRFISTVRGLGCRFALDDFGVGFSSFSYLKHLPVDYLKIDGSFVRNLPRDPADQHLVRAMVEVARGLGKQTIAEFVGDEETVRLLREYGVDYGQGYHIGRPHPASELLSHGLLGRGQLAA